MPEYLSKEEIKKWRSSLEKITLEEYAARLGKVIEEEKQTNDLIDIVLHGQPVMSRIDDNKTSRGEKISSIAQRAFEREKEIAHTPFALHQEHKKAPVEAKKEIKIEKKPEVKAIAPKKEEEIAKPVIENIVSESDFVFKKALTDREQMVFDYFSKNSNKVVYAKDLAKLLDLPRDYVYKYIKNLRAKIEGDKLQNADNGGYILTV